MESIEKTLTVTLDHWVEIGAALGLLLTAIALLKSPEGRKRIVAMALDFLKKKGSK